MDDNLTAGLADLTVCADRGDAGAEAVLAHLRKLEQSITELNSLWRQDRAWMARILGSEATCSPAEAMQTGGET